MVFKETLDIFDLWCPICGRKLLEKIIEDYKFIYCEDILGCEYYKVKGSDELQKDNVFNRCDNNNIFNKFRKFIHTEKKTLINSKPINKTSNQEIDIYGNQNLDAYIVGSNKDKVSNQKTDENNVSLVLGLLEKYKNEKSKIEVYREESRYKKRVQKSNISKKRLHREIERNKRLKNRELEMEEKLKKEEELKRDQTKKIFKEKYMKLFGGDLLKLENINNDHFFDHEIEIGRLLYKNQQLEIKKEEDNKIKEKKKEEHKKFVRKYEFI
ncbi:MAG: hypothetical protein LBC39_03120 [Methanobrevibacter sp.]|nr:hypothetical protein [Candidatus Methanovirga aequatorialis]